MLSGNESKSSSSNITLDKLIHYSKILGLPEGAPLAEIRKRFVSLARSGNINENNNILEAFEVLEQHAAEEENRSPLSPPDQVQVKLSFQGFFNNSSLINVEIKPTPPYLRIQDRPPEVQARIEKAFRQLAVKNEPYWGTHNAKEGDGAYFSCGIDMLYFVESIIKDNPKQKDFYIMDIGAGRFGFGRDLKNFLLAKNKTLPQDIRVHIISLRGEKAPEPIKKEEGICISYECGAFQIENILNELQSRNLNLIGKIDLVVSCFAFRHLVDPVGTFMQTYSLLKPGTGFLAMDSFISFYDDTPLYKNSENTHYLLALTKAPVLTYHEDTQRVIGRQFILKRPNQDELQLPFVYDGIEESGENSVIASQCAIRFKSLIPELRKRFDTLLYKKYSVMNDQLIGDKDLYDFLDSKEIWAYRKRDADSCIYGGPLIRNICEPFQRLQNVQETLWSNIEEAKFQEAAIFSQSPPKTEDRNLPIDWADGSSLEEFGEYPGLR